MLISKVEKIHSFQLKQKLKKEYLDGGEIDYKIRNFIDDICDDGIYEEIYLKDKPKLRLTFPLYLICIILFHFFAAIKWMFTGVYNYNDKNFFVRQMITWDRYCRFNLI